MHNSTLDDNELQSITEGIPAS